MYPPIGMFHARIIDLKPEEKHTGGIHNNVDYAGSLSLR